MPKFNIDMSYRWLVVYIFISSSVVSIDMQNAFNENDKVALTPNVYAKLLQTRREEHTYLIQTMLNSDYAKNYKMISLALGKIFEVIEQNNHTLTEEDYLPTEGFPVQQRKQEAVILVLENSCLAADIVLHFPEIAYKVLKNVPNWRESLNWCIDFVNNFPHITDEQIVELMELAHQEINEEARSSDFINPYYTKVETSDSGVKKRKSAKKIKKGPRLTTNTEL